MRPKKDKQEKVSEVLASTLDRSYMMRALLARDARSETLANLILQRYGSCPQEQERSDAGIIAEIATLCNAFSRDYGVPLPPIPTGEEVTEIRQDIIADLESDSTWLFPPGEEILASLDTACPALTAYMRHALSTQQVPDSLEADTLDPFVDHIMSPFLGLSGQQIEDDIRNPLRLVVQAIIAERHAQDYRALSDEEKEALITHVLTQRVKNKIVNTLSYVVLRMMRNRVAPGEPYIARHADGTVCRETSVGCPPPPGESPILTITIDLSKVHLVSVSELTKKFTSIVNEALKKLPTEWHTFPEELKFLRTIPSDDFERDLKRYDLHMKYGLTFREIAFLNRERHGHSLPSSPQPHTIGKDIPGDSDVDKSVKRIFTAIHRTSYRARRKRIDTPAQGQGPYFCPTHPTGDCPENCPNAIAFYKTFDATTPTDLTGQGKEIVALDAFIQAEEAQERKRLQRRGHVEDDS